MAHVIRSDWLLVLLTVLAVARLTHLLVYDFITDRPRAWIQEHGPLPLAYLVQCPWCLSIWIGFAGTPLVLLWGHHLAVQIPLLALSASYVTGLFEQSSHLVNAEAAAADHKADAA